MAVNTGSVKDRRELHFDTINDALAEVERLNGGQIKTLGNWSSGQVLRHLVILMTSSIDGFKNRPPWYIRLIGKMMKNRLLTKPMSAGFKLPPKALEELGPPPTEWADGVRMFREAVRRLNSESARVPSPFLGPMTREEWDQLHCRHAELHLSFLEPL